MRLIDADVMKEWINEYVSVFKKSDKRDIEGYIEHQPTIETKQVKYYDEDDSVWKIGRVIVDETD